MKKSDFIAKKMPILMTASVSTRGMKNACFTDEERETMYVETLTYYIQTLLKDKNVCLIFAENSGWDLNRLLLKIPSHRREQIEMIELAPELFDVTKGKGYNEILLMNMALEKSHLLRESYPANLVMGKYSCLASDVDCYIKDRVLKNK